MARLLFASTPLYGHFAPLRSIATDLVARGHDVTFITGTAFEGDVRAAGARFVPFSGAADVQLEDLAAERDQLAPGLEQLSFDLQRIFIDPVPTQHALIQRELAAGSGGPMVLLTDYACLGAWPSALGAPGLRPAGTIAIGISVYAGTSADAGPFGLGLPPDTSEAGRARNAEATAGFREAFASTQAHLEQVMAAAGATGPVPFFWDGIASVPDRLLQLGPAGFEYPRSDAPPGVRFIGPIPAEPSAAGVELPSWWDDLERAERVVVVTQGTLANRDGSALFAPALRALADLDALVVLTTGHDGVAISDVPANARVGGFVPFDLLLPHADVLVTNGGYGGVLKALSHGVPMVVAGDTEDKPEVAAHVAWSGAGVNLHTGHPSDAALGDAVCTVLADPSYARAAKRLQVEIADHHPFDEVAAEIDEVLRAGSVSASQVQHADG